MGCELSSRELNHDLPIMARCANCGCWRDRHEIEQPYPCYDCDCESYEIVKSGKLAPSFTQAEAGQ